MKKIITEWRQYLQEMTDQEKERLGNELLRLRNTEAGFEKNYHMLDFDEFFRVVKDIEKLPQSEDELYDAYMFAKGKQK
jgi:hypothetical protein|tara:strand:+ start:1576 stop:1812 length:237 start_codon:yes stop_codon:yes gene_type:complete